MAQLDPLASFDPQGHATILSYNVPQRTSLHGRHILRLGFEPDVFLDSVRQLPPRAGLAMDGVSEQRVAAALRTGDDTLFPHAQSFSAALGALLGTQTQAKSDARSGLLARALTDRALLPSLQPALEQFFGGSGSSPLPADRTEDAPAPAASARTVAEALRSAPALSAHATQPRLADLDLSTVVEQLRAGRRLNVYRTMWGDYAYSFPHNPPAQPRPQLVLAEIYRLTTFLGSYGAGRVVKTLSLLPGEHVKFTVHTYTKSEAEAKASSSILDSTTKEATDDFEHTLQAENSDKHTHRDDQEYHGSAEARLSWGWGGIDLGAGARDAAAAEREEFAKSVSTALDKHSSKASQKREVRVDAETDTRRSSGDEMTTERVIENINVSRTLNFVFRQMNQEFISILHLVDIRVGFFNGYAESAREVPLTRLPDLLGSVVKKKDLEYVYGAIKSQVTSLLDYGGLPVPADRPFVREASYFEDDPREAPLRVVREHVETYEDETGNNFTVPGVIMNVDKTVMRTDGVIVDSLLGQGEGLDAYSTGLQETAVAGRRLANDLSQEQAARAQLAREIARGGDEAAATRFATVFPPSSLHEPFSIDVRLRREEGRDGQTASTPTDAGSTNSPEG